MFWPLYRFFYEDDISVRKRRRELARRANRGDLDAAFELGGDAFNAGHPHIAEDLFGRVSRSSNPNGARSCFYLGRIAFSNRNYGAAIHYWDHASKYGTVYTKRDSLHNMGLAYLKLDRVSDAIVALEEAAELGLQNSKDKLKILKARPAPRFNMSPRDAELVAAQWMVFWGFYDAKATPVGSDGGIDIVSTEALGQVKYRTAKTGSPEINEFHGSSSGTKKFELFFTKEGYTNSAIERANEIDMALFVFNYEGIPKPLNSAARRIVARVER